MRHHARHGEEREGAFRIDASSAASLRQLLLPKAHGAIAEGAASPSSSSLSLAAPSPRILLAVKKQELFNSPAPLQATAATVAAAGATVAAVATVGAVAAAVAAIIATANANATGTSATTYATGMDTPKATRMAITAATTTTTATAALSLIHI